MKIFAETNKESLRIQEAAAILRKHGFNINEAVGYEDAFCVTRWSIDDIRRLCLENGIRIHKSDMEALLITNEDDIMEASTSEVWGVITGKFLEFLDKKGLEPFCVDGEDLEGLDADPKETDLPEDVTYAQYISVLKQEIAKKGEKYTNNLN